MTFTYFLKTVEFLFSSVYWPSPQRFQNKIKNEKASKGGSGFSLQYESAMAGD
jgi:hypothetical protein